MLHLGQNQYFQLFSMVLNYSPTTHPCTPIKWTLRGTARHCPQKKVSVLIVFETLKKHSGANLQLCAFWVGFCGG